MKYMKLCGFEELSDREPAHYQVNGLDLVALRYDDNVSVLYGRCLHRSALMSDGHIDGDNLICGLHGWDYRYDTGVSEYNHEEMLHKFTAEIRDGSVWVDEGEINAYLEEHPQPFRNDEYLGLYADTHPEDTEPYTGYIKELAQNGLKKYGRHGPTAAMGVDRNTLPKWEDIQFLPAQLATRPLMDDAEVNTTVVIGPAAKKPVTLAIPVFVSDMSFGALSREAKIALSKGAERAGTGICSGEGGIIPEERAANSRYFHELASGKFGYAPDKVKKAAAFHFKGGQGAKTGVGGHLPAHKVSREIAEVRGLKEGEAAVSPAAFPDLVTASDFREVAEEIREITGGLRVPEDFAKAMMLGADAVAVSNAALQAIGCLGMRACDSNNCPVGIATQKDTLRSRLIIDASAQQLHNFFDASTELMKVIARACGYDDLRKLNPRDLSTLSYGMHRFTGIPFAGIRSDPLQA